MQVQGYGHDNSNNNETVKSESCWQYRVYTKELMKDVVWTLEEEVGDANGCWEDVEGCY